VFLTNTVKSRIRAQESGGPKVDISTNERKKVVAILVQKRQLIDTRSRHKNHSTCDSSVCMRCLAAMRLRYAVRSEQGEAFEVGDCGITSQAIKADE
jgi:hypothetical protein